MKLFFVLLATMIASSLFAQQLPIVFLPADHTLHFISPEPIQYVDISSKSLEGDLPLKNVFRLRLRDTAKSFTDAIVTIAGEKFIAQYHLLKSDRFGPSEIEILPADSKPLDIAGIGFSQNQLYRLSLDLFSQKPEKNIEKVKAFGVEGRLLHIYTAGDYVFLDIAYRNKTNLTYDIEDFSFSIEDKKVTKASNVQTVTLKPVFTLFPVPSFSRTYRNIFVFRKMTFPGNKVFHIDLREKQLSGRIISLSASYRDILVADIIPL